MWSSSGSAASYPSYQVRSYRPDYPYGITGQTAFDVNGSPHPLGGQAAIWTNADGKWGQPLYFRMDPNTKIVYVGGTLTRSAVSSTFSAPGQGTVTMPAGTATAGQQVGANWPVVDVLPAQFRPVVQAVAFATSNASFGLQLDTAGVLSVVEKSTTTLSNAPNVVLTVARTFYFQDVING